MKKPFALLFGLLCAGAALAGWTPVQVSLVDPVQAPGRDVDVRGLRLSLIYGGCHDLTGLDLGLANYASGDFTGLAVGGFNIASGRVLGGQVGLVNWSGRGGTTWENRAIGAQIGLLNYANEFCGLQDGVVNVSGATFAGLQSGLVNVAQDLNGMSCGPYLVFGFNVAGGTVRGVQVGIVNYANTMEKGLQVGLVNIIAHNGWLPVLPIVNGRF